jgi:hypothetical protein
MPEKESCLEELITHRLKIPLIVGIRGSSHPHTFPLSTILVSFLFERTVRMKFNR